MPPAKAFNVVDSYIVNLLSVFRMAGICPPPNKWEEKEWRGGSPTERQLEALEKCKWLTRYLPKEVRVPFKLLVEKASEYNKGTINDMLQICWGLGKASKNARKNKVHYHPPPLRYPRPDFPIQTMLFVMENN